MRPNSFIRHPFLFRLLDKYSIQLFLILFSICLLSLLHTQNALTVLFTFAVLLLFPANAILASLNERGSIGSVPYIGHMRYLRLVLTTSILVLCVFVIFIFALDQSFQSNRDAGEIVVDAFDQNTYEFLFFGGALLASIALMEYGRLFASKIYLFFGLTWFAFYSSFSGLLKTLGADSFAESSTFDLSEAVFWLSTISDSVKPNIALDVLSLYTLITFSLYFVVQKIFHLFHHADWLFRPLMLICGCTGIVLSLHMTVSDTIVFYRSNSESFVNINKNFDSPLPDIIGVRRSINVVVYIGESTTSMNMGIYGYPRKTTPRLSRLSKEDHGLLVFHNVFSTHAHTYTSLLEALSFAVNEDEKFLPIDARARVSIVDLLTKAGVPVNLISNQGMSGTWNLASSVVFKRAKRTFGFHSRLLGNNASDAPKPWDHDLFLTHIDTLLKTDEASRSVSFLHSYAGHGDYRRNIPTQFRGPVDEYFDKRPLGSIRESGNTDIDRIQAYDSAIRYIDFSVGEVIERVKNSEAPTVFIYFSDHGESVFTGFGHDSSRFVHEMLRIPFIMYFNEPARMQNQYLFDKYTHLSKSRTTASLAQFSSTLIDILGIEVAGNASSVMLLTGLIGEKYSIPPLFVRELRNHISYLNLNENHFTQESVEGKKLVEVSDVYTRDYVSSKLNAVKQKEICSRKWSSFEEQRRYQLVANC